MFLRKNKNCQNPFYLVAGEGLGVSYSSHARDIEVLPSRSFGMGELDIFVNVANSNVVVKDRPIRLAERNGPLELRYIHNRNVSDVKKSWRLAVKKLTLPASSTITLTEEDGHQTVYTYQSSHYIAPGCTSGTPYITKEYGKWLIYYPESRIKEYYDDNGFLISKVSPEGQITEYGYDSNGELNRISGAYNYEIRRTPSSDGMDVEIIESVNGQQETLQKYHLDRYGRVETSVAPNGYTIRYKYRGDTTEIVTIDQTDGTEAGFTFDQVGDKRFIDRIYFGTAGKIEEKSIYEGSTDYRFTYNGSGSEITINDGVKIKSKITLDSQSRIFEHTSERGYEEVEDRVDAVRYSYYDSGLLESITYLEKRSAGVEVPYGQEIFTYRTPMDLLESHTELNGKKSRLYYKRGGDRPHIMTREDIVNGKSFNTHYVYDDDFDKAGSRHEFLRFVISPEGRVTEYIPDASGCVAATREYRDKKYICSENPKVDYSVKNLTDWAASHDPRHVILKEFKHNLRGQVEETISYAEVDEKGVGKKDASMSTEKVDWHALGFDLWLSRKVIQDSQARKLEFKTYDKMNRIKSSSIGDGLNQPETKYTYTDYIAERELATIKVTQPNGREEIKAINTIGLVDLESQQQVEPPFCSRKYKYLHDTSSGQPIVTIQPDGKRTITFYDKQYRLGYKVTPSGYVTEYRYDPLNRSCTTIRYSQPIDISKLYLTPSATLPDQLRLKHELERVADEKQDRVSYDFYNFSGVLVYSVDGEKFVTEHVTDTLGRDCGKISYADRISDDDLNKLKSGEPPELKIDSSRDRCYRKFYDKDNLLIATQDPAGYVIEYKRDFAGLITQKICYSTPSTIIDRTSELDAVRPKESEEDARIYYFYDGRKRLTLEVDSEGYVTSYEYKPDLKTTTTRFANKVDAEWFKNPVVEPKLPVASSEDRVTYRRYDSHDLEADQVNVFGKTIYNKYDEMDQQIERLEHDSTDQESIDNDKSRRWLRKYDQFSQLTSETPPAVAKMLADVDANQSLSREQKQLEKQRIRETQSLRFEYDSSGLKVKSINTLGNTTRYYYDSDRRLTVEIDPTGAVKEYTLNAYGENVATRYYETRIDKEALKTLNGGMINDSFKEFITKLRKDKDVIESTQYDKRGVVRQKTDGLSNVTDFEPNAFGEHEKEYRPVADKSTRILIDTKYDTRGLLIEKTETSKDINRTFKNEYKNMYGKVTKETDANSQSTIYGYYSNGQLKHKTNALNAKTTYKVDAFNRIEEVCNPANLVTKHVYDQQKRTVTIISPEPGCTTTVTTNIFDEKINSTNGLNEREEWQHTPDGQVVSHTDALSRVTINRFDTEGMLSEVISPDKVHAELKYNEAKQLIRRIDDATSRKYETKHEPDALGYDRKTTDPRNVVTDIQVDPCGVISQTTLDEKGLGLITEFKANAQKDIVSIKKGDAKTPDQSMQLIQRDSLGRKTGDVIDPVTPERSQALEIKTEQKLDLMNRVIVEIDGNSNKTQFFYDELGRKRIMVDASGGIKEWEYNELDQVVSTRIYQQRVSDKAKITDAKSLSEVKNLITRNPLDNVVLSYYDKNGDERFQVKIVNMLNSDTKHCIVTEKRYDKARREIQSTNYFNTLKFDDLVGLDTQKLAAWVEKSADKSKDQTTYRILDAGGRERFVIDAEGYITEKHYDTMDRLIAKVEYANRLTKDPAEVAKLPLDKVRSEISLNTEKDKSSYYSYNSLGQLEFEVNPELAITSYKRNYYGDVEQECHFKEKIKEFKSYDDLVSKLRLLEPNRSIDHVTEHVYDAARRKEKTIDANGKIKRFKYDALGNVKDVTDETDHVWKHEYDRASRLVEEKTPPVSKPGDQKVDPVQIKTKHITDKSGNKTDIIEALDTPSASHFNSAFDTCNALISTKLVEPEVKRPKNGTPVPLVDQCVYDAQHQKVAEKNQAGQWTFFIYDSQGREIYRINNLGYVTGNTYDALGNIVTEIQYATKLPLDLSEYTETGIPLLLLILKNKTSALDQIKEMTHDRRGNVISSTTRLRENKKSEQAKEYKYDAFRRLVVETDVVDQESKRYKKHTKIYDKTDQVIAEIDPTQHVTRYNRNTFNEVERKTEYFEPLKKQVDSDTTISEIDASVTTSALDRKHEFEYDQLGQVTHEKLVDARIQKTVQDPSTKKSIITDEKSVTLDKVHTYNSLGKLISTTFNGSTEYKYYDERGDLIAETGVPFKSTDEKGQPITIIPLTYYERNELRQIVKETRFKKGAKEAKPDAFPLPVAKDPGDIIKGFEVDKLDRIKSTTIDPDKLAIKMANRYNAGGQPIIDIDPNGNETRFIYDGLGNKRFKIDALGGVTEWRYDAFNKISCTRIYNEKIDKSVLSDLSDEKQLQSLVKASEQDSLLYYFYDGANRERFCVEVANVLGEQKNVGIVHEKRYTISGALTEKISYDNTLDASAIETFTTSTLAERMKELEDILEDQHTYYIRNEAGQVRFIINPNGVVTQKDYDAYGNMIRKTKYDKPLADPESLSNLTPEEMAKHIIANPERDRTSFFMFNAFNKLLYAMGPEGNVRRHAYDANGNKIATTRVSKMIDIPQSYDEFLKAMTTLQPDIESDRTTVKKYDEASQVIEKIDAEGYSDKYKFDGLGHVTEHVNRVNGVTSFGYDAAGRRELVTQPEVMTTSIDYDAKSETLVPSQSKCRAVEKTEFDKAGNPSKIIKGFGTSKARTFTSEYTASRKVKKTTVVDAKVDDGSTISSFSQRPEKVTSITTESIRDTKDLVVAEKKESGEWIFHTYDSRGKLIFDVHQSGAVTEYQRSTFGYLLKAITYGAPIKLNFDEYIKNGNGIPAKDIQNAIIEMQKSRDPKSPADRVTMYDYDKLGNVSSIKKNKILFYSPRKNAILEESPETVIERNSFNEEIRNFVRRDTDAWSETITWRDRNGKAVAELSSMRYLTRYKRNAFGEEGSITEFSTKQDAKEMADPTIPLSKVDSLTVEAPDTDRAYSKKYNCRGKVKSETLHNEVVDELKFEDKTPKLVSVKYDELTIQHEYDGLENENVTTYEDLSQKFTYRNACGEVIAEADIPRRSRYEDEKPTLIPFTEYGIDLFGNTISTVKYKEGVAEAKKDVLPTPIQKEHKENKLEYVLTDSRGLPIVAQDADGNVRQVSFTESKSVAREWWKGATWQGKGKTKESKEEYKKLKASDRQLDTSIIDERRHTYDPVRKSLEIGSALYRNNVLVEQVANSYNIFNEQEGVGLGDGQWPLYSSYDATGFKWNSNREGYAPTIVLTDLAGTETLRLQSPVHDLRAIDYRDISSLLALGIQEIERSVTAVNLEGQLVSKTSPALYQVKTTDPINLALQIQAKGPTLTWPLSQVTNVTGVLVLNPVGYKDKPISKEIKKIGNCCVVDMSDLPSDQYEYQIKYYLTGTESKDPLYVSSGVVQCDTGITAESKNAIVQRDLDRKDRIWLTGNTATFASVKLLADDKVVDEIKVSEEAGRKYIDLSAYPSGQYRLRPVVTSGPQLADTALFPVYTAHPSEKAFAREIAFRAHLVMRGVEAQIILDVPDELYRHPIELICHYTSEGDNREFKHVEKLEFDQKKKCYVTEFKSTVQVLKSFSVNMQIASLGSETEETVTIPLYCDEKPMNSGVTLRPSLIPPTLKLRDAEDLSTSKREEKSSKQERVIFDEDELGVLVDVTDASEVVYEFVPRVILYITPYRDLDKIPVVTYKDVSQDLSAHWKNVSCTGVTKEGFVIDVTDFTPGHYPFKLIKDGVEIDDGFTFFVTYGTLVFPGLAIDSSPQPQNVQRSFDLDRWHNILEEKDSLGKVTNSSYSKRNKLVLKIQPEIECMEDDDTVVRKRPVTKYGFNTRGFYIGTTDARDFTKGYIVNEAGQVLVDIAGDGVFTRMDVLDALGRVVSYFNSLKKEWKQEYNGNDQLVSILSPVGYKITNGYFNKKRILEDNMGRVSLFDFDGRDNLIFYLLPDGKRWTRMSYNQVKKITEKITFDGQRTDTFSTQYHDLLPYPKRHIDIGGAVYAYGYDLKWQTTMVQSTGGAHGQYIDLKRETQLVKIPRPPAGYDFVRADIFTTPILPVPGQWLEYVSISGRLMSVIDRAMKKTTNYFYDTEDRVVAIEVRKMDGTPQGTLLSRRDVQFNEIGLMVNARDRSLTLITTPDAVSNRRRVKSILSVPGEAQPRIKEITNRFDRAERETFDGVQGLEIGYDPQSGLRVTEKGGDGTKVLGYYDDGLLRIVTRGTEVLLLRDLDDKRQLQKLTTKDGNDTITAEFVRNANSWVVEQRSYKNSSRQTTTSYPEDCFLISGQCTRQNTDYHEGVVTRDELSFDFVLFDSRQLSKVYGTRCTTHWGGVTISTILCDSNGHFNAVLSTVDGERINEIQPQIRLFDTTSDGVVLNKLTIPQDRKENLDFTEETIFTTANNLVMGTYGIGRSPGIIGILRGSNEDLSRRRMDEECGSRGMTTPSSHIVIDNPRPPRERGWGPQVKGYVADQYAKSKELTLSTMIKAISSDYPPTTMDTYVVPRQDESLPEAALDACGTETAASAIAVANGLSEYDRLDQGMQLRIPEYIPSENGTNMYPAYSKLMNSFIGNLCPHLITRMPPEPHHSFFQDLITVIVTGVAMIAAPYLAVELLTIAGPALATIGIASAGTAAAATAATTTTFGSLSFGSSVAFGVATGVSAALTDAVAQEVLVKCNIQSHFSLKGAVSTGLAAGMGAGFGAFSKDLDLSARMIAAGKGAAAAQLIGMYTGVNDRFDLGQVVTAMASAGISERIGYRESDTISQRFARAMVENSSDALIYGAFHTQQTDMSQIAAQALGSSITREADRAVADMNAKRMKKDVVKREVKLDARETTTGRVSSFAEAKASKSGMFSRDSKSTTATSSTVKDKATRESKWQGDAKPKAPQEDRETHVNSKLAERHEALESLVGYETDITGWEPSDLSPSERLRAVGDVAKDIGNVATAIGKEVVDTVNPVTAVKEISEGVKSLKQHVNEEGYFTKDTLIDAGKIGVAAISSVPAIKVAGGIVKLSARALIGGTARIVSAMGARESMMAATSEGISVEGRYAASNGVNLFTQGKAVGTGKLAINSSSPSEIAWGYGKLSDRQNGILESLPKPGRYFQLHKSDINMTDLSALTAYTGDEFALFTLGSQRIVVRGTSKDMIIRGNLNEKLLSEGWKWSAHTHPGLSDRVLMASGMPGDRQALQMFRQERSLILNSAGRRSIFDLDNDYAITNQVRLTLRPGY